MKNNNKLIYTAAILASALLLWLWLHLGFNHVDPMLDLVLSVIWWAIVAVSVVATNRVEDRRRMRRRSCFVAVDHVFNPEFGVVAATSPEEDVERMMGILDGMRYGMAIEEMPRDERGNLPGYLCVVRSETFDAKDGSLSEDATWEGEVVVASRPGAKPIRFSGAEQLRGIISRLRALEAV